MYRIISFKNKLIKPSQETFDNENKYNRNEFITIIENTED